MIRRKFPRADKGELGRLGALVFQAVVNWKYGSGQPETAAEARLRKHAQAVVWQVRRAFEAAAGTGFTDELIRLIEKVAPPSTQVRAALIAWVTLVEVLVQEAEREYGSAAGRGSQKAEQVKAALIHLMIDRSNLKIPDIPDFLVPIIAEIGVNWTIDSVVLILNHNSLWEPAPVLPSARLSVFARVVRNLLRFGRWLIVLAPVARLGGWLAQLTRRLVLMAYPLSPEVRAAVTRIETTQGTTIEDAIVRGVALLQWIGEHHEQVVALIQVVSFAVQEAEFIGQLSGSEKKVYARELILAFLENIGLIGQRTGLLYQLVDSVLDPAIDAVVAIFNTRADSFGKRTRDSTRSSLAGTQRDIM